METAIRMTGVTKTFGALTAVDDLDLEVPRGGLYGFIGALTHQDGLRRRVRPRPRE